MSWFYSLSVVLSLVTACQRTGGFENEDASSTSAIVSRERTDAEISVKAKSLSFGTTSENSFSAKNGKSWKGFDGAASHQVSWSGPLSNQMSALLIETGSNCSHAAMTQSAIVLAICGPQDGGYQIISQATGAEPRILARTNLPTPSENFLKFAAPYPVILDHQDGLLIGTPDQKILRVSFNDADASGTKIEELVDLKQFKGDDKSLRSEDGGLSAIALDYRGLIWFTAENGVVGYFDVSRQIGAFTRLIDPKTTEPELITNHMAIAPDNAIFVVTTHALYRIEKSTNSDGVTIIWKEEYERGSGIKKGQTTQGSGTGPVLIGDDFVAIGDNREIRMSVMVYRRSTSLKSQRKFCEQPVFKLRNSAGEAAMSSIGHSIIVQNSFGYTGPESVKDLASSEAGLARIDLNESEGSCKIIWNRPIAVPNLSPVISVEAGLIYVYAKKGIGWYLMAIDYLDGQSPFDIRVGGTDAYVAENGSMMITPNGNAVISHRSGFSYIGNNNSFPQQSETMPLLLDQK